MVRVVPPRPFPEKMICNNAQKLRNNSNGRNAETGKIIIAEKELKTIKTMPSPLFLNQNRHSLCQDPALPSFGMDSILHLSVRSSKIQQ